MTYSRVYLIRVYLIRVCLITVAGIYQSIAVSQEAMWERIPNYERTFLCPENEVYSPANVDQVQQIVRNAIQHQKKIMTGTRKFNSQIDAACAGSGQVQIITEHLNKVLEINHSDLTVKAEAGLRLYELNEILRREGLSINMISEGGFFSIGGMLGSDTHGSTMTQPASLSDYVIAMTIVDGFGNIRKITGEALKATRVNLGVLGVVVDATFKVEPLKKVSATIHNGTNDDIIEAITNLPFNNYSVSLAWFPGIKKWTATVYNFVPIDTPGDAVNSQAHLPNWMFKAFRELISVAQAPAIPFATCSFAKIRHSLRAKSYFSENGNIVENPVGYSDQMQYFTCNDSKTCPWEILPIVVGGFSIPIKQLPQWIKDVESIIDENSRPMRRVCLPLNGIYFRFSKSSENFIALNQGHNSVFIDLEYVVNTNGADDNGKKITATKSPKFYAVYQEIEQLSLQKYNARPHWGKNFANAFYNLGKRQYPHWDQFINYKNKVDPHNVFTNPWWDRIKTKGANVRAFTECALDGSCICQKDHHCPDNLSCLPGKWYQKSRVCRSAKTEASEPITITDSQIPYYTKVIKNIIGSEQP